MTRLNHYRLPTASRLAPIAAAVLAVLGTSVMPSVGEAQQQQAQPRPEEIIVTSSILEQPRRQIGTAVSVIDFDEIELRGYNALEEVLRTQTGIGVSNSGGPGKSTTIRIRGEEGYRTTLLIDGIKAVDASAPQTAPSFDSLLATNDIQRVEVLRGPQGFMYGADAGGVVNIITGRGEGPLGGRVGLEYGEFDTTKIDANITGGGDTGDYFFSISDLDTEGFNAQVSDAVLADKDGADNTTLHTKLGWNATENVRLQLVARDIDASTLYDGCGFPPIHDCRGTTEQTTYKASLQHTADKISNLIGYSDVSIDRDNFTANVSSFRATSEIKRIEYTGSFKASDAHTLAYGVDLEEDYVTETSPFSSAIRQRDQDGYYFEYQGAYAERFYLSAGARYDDNEDFGSHTSTRLSAAYVQDFDGGSSLKYRASIGTGFRAPSLFEIGYNQRPFGVHPDALANPLVEEQSEGYDIGIDYTGANGLLLEITYFDQEITDQISYVSAGAPNFEDGYIQTPGVSASTGIELGVDVPIGANWAFLANWTNNDAKTATGAARLRRPENLGNLGVRYVSPSEALSFMANYRLSYDAVDFGNVPLDDYEVLDLSINYAFNETFELFGRIQNATDEQYREVNNFNSADRAAYAGVRLKF